MKTTLLLSVLLVAAALAGCANDADDGADTNTTSPTTGTSPTSTTPAATPAATPATTPATNGTGGMPPMMECEGDYATEDSNATRLGMPELSFTAKDPTAEDPCYAFVGPQNATAGWNVISLEYPAGMEFHIMPMYAVGEHTQEDVLEAFAADEEPSWARPVGAVGGVTPGQSGSVAMLLEEGNYFYFCPINGHMFQGMMGMLAVTGNATDGAEEPNATVSIDLVDYNFTVEDSIPANTTVIKVTNKGAEPHEMPLVLLNANTTAMQFLTALEDPNATAPPPGALIGGVNAIAPGETVYVLVELEAGRRYAAACFVESESHGGAPHVAIGPMVAEWAAA